MNGIEFEQRVRAGFNSLNLKANYINDLNVFPVPDGDTGSNMLVTLKYGIDETATDESIGVYAAGLARGMLLGARGNSGVIFSQFVKGIAAGLKDVAEAGTDDFIRALRIGYQTAYGAVMKPAEGTFLTVAREGIEKTAVLSDRFTDEESFFAVYLHELKKSLDHTPDLMELLRKAGVVDSGGMGLFVFFEGFTGKEDSLPELTSERPMKVSLLDLPYDNDDEDWGFCTEFILQLHTPVPTDMLSEFTSYLEETGKSLVVVRDEDIFKVHVHTLEPLDVLQKAARYGTFYNVKIENMDIQSANHSKHLEGQTEQRPHKAIAYVAVAQGEGLKGAFEEFGCDEVLTGGQTMNTSVDEFLEVFKQLNADTIIVLPNNSNIYAAARQAKELDTEHEVLILDTKSAAEGYFAMSMVVGDDEDAAFQLESMQRGKDQVLTIEFTKAVRQSDLIATPYEIGDYIGLSQDEIISCNSDLESCILNALQQVENLEDKEAILFIKGKDLDEDLAYEIIDSIQDQLDIPDIGLIDGGQDVYDCILGITG